MWAKSFGEVSTKLVVFSWFPTILLDPKDPPHQHCYMTLSLEVIHYVGGVVVTCHHSSNNTKLIRSKHVSTRIH